jgi:hypothetical protein
MKIANATADAMNDAATARLNGGTLRFYTGAQPANADAAVTGTLVAECVFGNPAFGASVNGVATANAITQDASTNNAGTPGYARATTSGGGVSHDFSVGAVGSGADIEINPATLTAGVPFSVTALTLTQPKG